MTETAPDERGREEVYRRHSPRSSRDGSRSEKRRSKGLLHTAINQNRHMKLNLPQRSASSHSLQQRNIPMMDTLAPTSGPSRAPKLKRWSSYTLLDSGKAASSTDPPAEELDGSSISPLTMLHDQYNIKRPPHQGMPNTGNSFSDLRSLRRARTSDPHFDFRSDAPSESTITNSKPAHKSVLARMSNMVSLAHNSMHSLVPMFSHEKPDTRGTSFSAQTSGHISSGNISRYQSESDDSDDDLDHDADPDVGPGSRQNGFGATDTSNIDLGTDSSNIQQIITDINAFQSTFVDKFGSTQAQPTKSSRTQQKILDYKELYSFDSGVTLASMGTPNNNPASHKTYANSFPNMSSYSVRIQCETITSQYTSIRLRFGSSSSDKRQLGTNTGVLGYLNRVRRLKNHGRHGWWTSQERTDPIDMTGSTLLPVNMENKDKILQNIWDTELSLLYPERRKEEEEEKEYQGDADFSITARNVHLNP